MAYKQMITPCMVDCASCVHYLANENPAALVRVEKWSALLNIPTEIIMCKGCWAQTGQIPFQKHLFGDNYRCSIYGCAQGKKTEYCGLCEQFPCDASSGLRKNRAAKQERQGSSLSSMEQETITLAAMVFCMADTVIDFIYPAQ